MNTVVTTILTVVPGFLRAVASAPAASSFLTPIVDEILNAGAALIERGDEATQELQALTDQVKAMVSANRDPTEDEWAALKARSDAAHAAIQSASPASPAATTGVANEPAGPASEPAGTPAHESSAPA